jgi:hypothetical protein
VGKYSNLVIRKSGNFAQHNIVLSAKSLVTLVCFHTCIGILCDVPFYRTS